VLPSNKGYDIRSPLSSVSNVAIVESFDCILSFFLLTFQVAKLLGTNVGTIQQDLSILLKDESIEVSKKVIFSIPK